MKLILLHNSKKQTDHIKMLNEIALELRWPYVRLMDKLSEGKEHSIDWWVSRIASRNPYESDLFIHFCYLILIKRILSQNNHITEITVDSKYLATVIKKYLKNKQIDIKVTSKANIIIFLKLKIRLLYHYLMFLINVTKRYLAAIKTGKQPIILKNITILDNFIFNSSFKNGQYYDRYYPKLHQYCSPEEKSKIFYLPAYIDINNFSNLFKQMRKSEQSFIIEPDYLKPSDYIFALLYPFRMIRFKSKITFFDEFDITPLIKNGLSQSMFSVTTQISLLRYRLVRRLKENNISIRLVIDWFENQTIDRGFVAGIRKYFPNTPIIGYQGFIVSKHYQCAYPTEKEFHAAIIPHTIAVIGKKLINSVKEFYPDLNVKTAPALRFDGIWKKRKYFPQTDTFIILVSLPIMLLESFEIIELLSQVISTNTLSGIHFLIKMHPARSPYKTIIYCKKMLNRQYEIVDGSFDEYIEKSHLLIGNNSSTCMAALGKGIPVIIIGSRSGLTHNPIPDGIPKEMWSICHSSNEAIKQIRKHQAQYEITANFYRELGTSIRDGFFEKVTKKNVREFLQYKS